MTRQLSTIAAQSSETVAVFAASHQDVEDIQSSLQKLGIQQAEVQKSTMPQTINWCKNNQPDTLIVDLDSAKTPLKDMNELFQFCDPTCRVIALGSQHDINLYRDLLNIGVVDYLTKPLMLDLLSASLQRSGRARGDSQAKSIRSGRTLAVSAVAGGLGVSTLVAAMAKLLSEDRKTPVSVVDFDRLKSDQGLLLGSKEQGNLNGIINSPEIDSRLLERSMNDINERLNLLHQSADYQPLSREINIEQLFTVGSHLCQLSNYVLWDIPASLPLGSMEVLQHAQVRILITELSVTAARHTRNLLQQIGDESEGQQLFLVANQIHGEKPVIAKDAFEDFIGRPVDCVLPFAGQILAQTLVDGPLNIQVGTLRDGISTLLDRITGQASSPPKDKRGLGNIIRLAFGRKPA